MDVIKSLKGARDADNAGAAYERGSFEDKMCALMAELDDAKKRAATEQHRLQSELALCRSELKACTVRLAKTHEALGLTADKARRLELAEGRLQIDLDGTLSTLEEAQRRHEEQREEAEAQREKREVELGQMLETSETKRFQLERLLRSSRAAAQATKEQLAQRTVAFDKERLEMKHEIERLTDQLAAVEADRLDPSKLANVAFLYQQGKGVQLASAPVARVTRFGADGSKQAVVSAVPLRGRLQVTVPPTHMASPTVM